MKKHGRIYVEAKGNVEKDKEYTVTEAIKLVKSLSKRKFDETVEVAINLNIDTTKGDQQVRSSFVLPNGTGKTKKILVVTKTSQEDAKAAGADYVGDTDMIEKIEKENWFDFDVIIATPDMMASLGKLGKILGPKGLMPNPKTGTVTMDISKAVAEVKQGRIEYRTDSYGNVHVIIGKVSFDSKQLLENLEAFVSLILKTKPSVVKGTYVKNISVSTTMGPGIKIDANSFDK